MWKPLALFLSVNLKEVVQTLQLAAWVWEKAKGLIVKPLHFEIRWTRRLRQTI
jgi:hypothetical protein